MHTIGREFFIQVSFHSVAETMYTQQDGNCCQWKLSLKDLFAPLPELHAEAIIVSTQCCILVHHYVHAEHVLLYRMETIKVIV